jgi:hypothetical protein
MIIYTPSAPVSAIIHACNNNTKQQATKHCCCLWCHVEWGE